MHEIPNFGTPGDTLIAVVLGALLAALGGFAAARLEARISRAERQRDAALLLGEIVFTFSMVLKMAVESRTIGDPYGPITMRMLAGARREADAYERNRERLADLREAPLRIRIHTGMITLTMTLDGLLEANNRLDALPAAAAGKATGASLRASRDQSFDFLAGTVGGLDPTITRLGALAKMSFDRHEAIVRAFGTNND